MVSCYSGSYSMSHDALSATSELCHLESIMTLFGLTLWTSVVSPVKWGY